MITTTNKIFHCLPLWLLLLGVMILSPLTSRATHLVGGELSLLHLQGDQYQLSLYVFFDNINGNVGADDPSVLVSIFRENDKARMQDIVLPRLTSQNLSFQIPQCATSTMSTRRIIYRETVTLYPGFYSSSGGYYIVWDRCCRNNSINNISLPGQTGMVTKLHFPRLDANGPAPNNSSPMLGLPNESYACAGQVFTADLSATDADGDSLAYSLTTPLRGYASQNNPSANPPLAGPYNSVYWMPGYTAQQFTIGAQPPHIDPYTGLLSLNSFNTGLFVYAVKIDEYRNGVHIGSVQRDFQLTVQACPNVSPPHVALKNRQGQTVPVSDTIVLDLKEERCLTFKLVDTTVGQGWTTSVETVQPSLPLSQPSLISNTPLVGYEVGAYNICIDPCLVGNGGIWEFDLVAREVNCPVALETKRRVVLRVIGSNNTRPFIYTDFDVANNSLRYGENIIFNVYGEDTVDAADQLSLSMVGDGFNPAALGMSLSTSSSRVKVNGKFTWGISCQSPPPAGDYGLIFIVSDNSCENNAKDSISVTLTIEVEEETKPFSLPNIVTANGDGMNEYFELPVVRFGACADQFAGIKIFNRWGKMVFESYDPTLRWNGHGLPTGHYYYLVTYGDKTYKGFVTLMR